MKTTVIARPESLAGFCGDVAAVRPQEPVKEKNGLLLPQPGGAALLVPEEIEQPKAGKMYPRFSV